MCKHRILLLDLEMEIFKEHGENRSQIWICSYTFRHCPSSYCSWTRRCPQQAWKNTCRNSKILWFSLGQRLRSLFDGDNANSVFSSLYAKCFSLQHISDFPAGRRTVPVHPALGVLCLKLRSVRQIPLLRFVKFPFFPSGIPGAAGARAVIPAMQPAASRGLCWDTEGPRPESRDCRCHCPGLPSGIPELPVLLPRVPHPGIASVTPYPENNKRSFTVVSYKLP